MKIRYYIFNTRKKLWLAKIMFYRYSTKKDKCYSILTSIKENACIFKSREDAENVVSKLKGYGDWDISYEFDK